VLGRMWEQDGVSWGVVIGVFGMVVAAEGVLVGALFEPFRAEGGFMGRTTISGLA